MHVTHLILTVEKMLSQQPQSGWLSSIPGAPFPLQAGQAVPGPTHPGAPMLVHFHATSAHTPAGAQTAMLMHNPTPWPYPAAAEHQQHLVLVHPSQSHFPVRTPQLAPAPPHSFPMSPGCLTPQHGYALNTAAYSYAPGANMALVANGSRTGTHAQPHLGPAHAPPDATTYRVGLHPTAAAVHSWPQQAGRPAITVTPVYQQHSFPMAHRPLSVPVQKEPLPLGSVSSADPTSDHEYGAALSQRYHEGLPASTTMGVSRARLSSAPQKRRLPLTAGNCDDAPHLPLGAHPLPERLSLSASDSGFGRQLSDPLPTQQTSSEPESQWTNATAPATFVHVSLRAATSEPLCVCSGVCMHCHIPPQSDLVSQVSVTGCVCHACAS
jgi:hypothetical protein